MNAWKKGDTNKICINQVLVGFCVGGFLDFLYNGRYLAVFLCAALGGLNYYIAKHKSPK